MKKLLNLANNYAKECTWKDFSLLKICLSAFGVLIGLTIPARRRKSAAWIAALVFIVTYIPQIIKLLLFASRDEIGNIYE